MLSQHVYAVHGDPLAAMQRPTRSANKPVRDGRVATVEVVGLISRDGQYGTSSDSAAREVKALAANDDVSCLALFVSSPGGMVQGTKELGDAIALAAMQKPVLAFIQDIGASAAYWVASQATKVYSEPMAISGGIGTYSVVADTSGMANQLGAKIHVIRAGKFKGAGTPGTPVTDEHLSECQRIIDSLNQHFVTAVAAGRKLSVARVQELADGRVHVGQEAVKLGLIDGVLSYDSFTAQLRAMFSQQPQSKGGSLMFDQERAHGTQSETFWGKVEEMMERGVSQPKAIERVIIANPTLHQGMLQESNAARR